MYAGTTIRHGSGRFVGVHQKIDRAARRHLKKILPSSTLFPAIKDILYFEGNNGPDGIKRKSPGSDQVWYFINPKNNDDRELINLINDHIINLSIALNIKDNIKASFEAAWLAHAIVDGLTPAHHYPLGEKIEELWGKSQQERFSIWDKNVIKGSDLKDTLSKNWQYWGAKGVFTTHGMFEMGVASVISTENFKEDLVDKNLLLRLNDESYETIFLESLKKINSYKMYEAFTEKGWTKKLASQTRDFLLPEIINLVALSWYKAVILKKEDIS